MASDNDAAADAVRVTWMAVDSQLKAVVGRGEGEVPLKATLVDAVALLRGEQATSQCELFAARRDGSWLTRWEALTFGLNNLQWLTQYMSASSALKMTDCASVFQDSSPARTLIQLIIKEPSKTDVQIEEKDSDADHTPATKKQKISKLSLHELAHEFTLSSFAKPRGRGGWMFQLRSHADQVDCHRLDHYSPSTSWPLPLVLLHKAFASFQDDCQRVAIGADDVTFVMELCRALARSDHHEGSFTSAARTLISTYLGFPVVAASHDAAERNASILHSGRLVLNVVCKAARGGAGGDPTMRSIAHYLKHMPQVIDRRFPCFLLELCGPSMALFGMCNTSDSHAVCEPLTIGFPLLWCDNETLMTSLVRTWVALKKGVAALINEDRTTFVTLHSIAFPYKREYTIADGDTFGLSYMRRITRHVFDVVHSPRTGFSHPRCLVIVKFARHYSTDLHDFCHAQGHAPKLLHHERIAGGWIFLVMEKIDDLAPIWASPDKTQIHQQLKALTTDFHVQGLVHGDLRDTNVAWDPAQRRIVVLDFDWSGREGVVRYPSFMNPQIRWPSGTSTGELITVDHDRHFLKMLN